MSKQEILEFINSNLVCYFATSENNQPHVRVLGAYRVDNKGIIFQTWKKKDLYKQIEANPFVEICFLNQVKNLQVRVKGKIVINKDENLNNEIIDARPFIKPWIDEVGLDALVVFAVVDCKACVWDFEMNFASKEYIQITE